MKKAVATLSDTTTVKHIGKEHFNEGLFLAASLFSKRLAQSRHLIIRSCGNCPSYTIPDALIYSRILKSANWIVHSYGDYEMSNPDTDDVTFGYDHKKAYHYNAGSDSANSDSLVNNQIEHEADLCSRIAVKTDGSVFNIKSLRQLKALALASDSLQDLSNDYSNSLKQCEKADTEFGDIIDFSYSRTRLASADDDE